VVTCIFQKSRVLEFKNLIEVGKLIDIKVLDHVIIGHGKWWSWVEDERI